MTAEPEIPPPRMESTRLADRYTFVEQIGEGGQATAWRALDGERGDEPVVVKQLTLRDVPDWKTLELFEREAETLQSLDHPQVPAYVDHDQFRDEEAGEAALFLVQEYVEGDELGELVDAGRVFEERQVRELLDELLEVVAHLHGHSPPIVHRDIKPTNIIVREEAPLALVDFGAVQVVAADTAGGSTVIGTAGYVPVEQLMGKATPRSDVYAIGATAVHLLTGKHPAELEVERNQLQFRDNCNVSDAFAAFVDKLVAPAEEDRFADAGEALEALRDDSTGDSEGAPADGGEETELPVARPRAPEMVRKPPSGVTTTSVGAETVAYRFGDAETDAIVGPSSVAVRSGSSSGGTARMTVLALVGLGALLVWGGMAAVGVVLVLILLGLEFLTRSMGTPANRLTKNKKVRLKLHPEGYTHELGAMPPFKEQTTGSLDEIRSVEKRSGEVYLALDNGGGHRVADVGFAEADWMTEMLEVEVERLRRLESGD